MYTHTQKHIHAKKENKCSIIESLQWATKLPTAHTDYRNNFVA